MEIRMGRVTITLAAIALFCFLAAIAEAQNLTTFDIQYPSFDHRYTSNLSISNGASISSDPRALQLTPDSGSNIVARSNISGRVLLNRTFKMWENTTTPRLASFNTSFLINIFSLNGSHGEGLAFLIAPDLLLPENSSGEYLGLTNPSTDGDPANGVVAVELDTIRQDFDPDDNHIGIDVNSVRSIVTESLTPFNITLVSDNSSHRFYNVWVDYDGDNMAMYVYISRQIGQTGPTPPKPAAPILSAANLDLRNYISQYSYFGFAASTGINYQLNCVLRWNLTVNSLTNTTQPEGSKKNIFLEVGVPVLVVVLLLLVAAAVALGYYWHRRQKALTNPNLMGRLRGLPGMPREFGFRDLKKATNGFDEKHKLGEGGFGAVYKGVLVKENMEIAVKWFLRNNIKGQDEFLAELTIINRLRHKHLVKLLGWCHKNGKLLLVYEYMVNGSLDQHLFAGPNVKTLEWDLRYKIISGVASALHYLHNEYDQRVVHRDIKASNIMLDSNFNARLGDFGLARALDNEKTSYAEAQGVLGTMGYIAPECFLTGKATQQSDVYAFGMVILEVVCGVRPGTSIAGFHFLVDWVWVLHRDGRLLEAVDQRLGDEYVEKEARRLVLMGLACTHPDANERPKMQDIVQMLSGTVPVPTVPPFKPAFVWPASGPMDLGSLSETTTFTSTFTSTQNLS